MYSDVGYVYKVYFFFQAEDGIRDRVASRGLGEVYKRRMRGQVPVRAAIFDRRVPNVGDCTCPAGYFWPPGAACGGMYLSGRLFLAAGCRMWGPVLVRADFFVRRVPPVGACFRPVGLFCFPGSRL